MKALAEFAGECAAVTGLREQVREFLRRQATAPRQPPVLIQGETGTGKGLLARALHHGGPRASGPFVDVNCAAIPETLLEAELFGYERGAFTDARQAKPGLFQAAHGGTLFLDEIGLLPPALQSKLLTLLEAGAVRRLGSTRVEHVNVWIITATNEDLIAAVRARRFREDLYHRLAVMMFTLPPLRERGRDVTLLAEQFLMRLCAEYGLARKSFDDDALAALAAYRWPGNVRQLNNVIERAILLSESDVIDVEALQFPHPTRSARDRLALDAPSPDPASRAQLVEALAKTSWNISQTAALLGLARNTVRARITKFGLTPPTTSASGKTRRRLPDVDRTAETGNPVSAAAGPVAAAPGALRWNRRRVAVLRVHLGEVDAAGEPPVGWSGALKNVIEKVQSFGGAVEAISFDGFDASFGIEPIENAPRRAAHAALAIARELENPATPSAPITFRIAIHGCETSVVSSGNVGWIAGESRQQITPILDRLIAPSEPGTIVVSADAAPFLRRRFVIEPIASSEVDLRMFRLLSHATGQFDLQGSEKHTRFVGRAQEIGLLESRLDAAVAGRGQLAAIVGDPGVGKSRLVWEFTRAVAPRNRARIIETFCVDGATTPYLPVIELLRRYLSLTVDDDAERISERLSGLASCRDGSLKTSLSALRALLGSADPEWEALDPIERRRRTLDAMKRLFVNESRTSPLVVVFEDMHWIDSESRAVLDAIAEGLPAARMLVVATCRPQYPHHWSNLSYCTQLSLGPLPAQSVDELLENLLGTDASLESLKRSLVAWADGNPFFLEESVQTLIETGVLEGTRGAYRRVGTSASATQVPATVNDILVARIERLPVEEKTLLQAAAAIGADGSTSTLAAIADVPAELLRGALRRLHGAELLYESGATVGGGFVFKHALTREVAYRTLVPETRRELHRKIVAVFEANFEDSRTPNDRLEHAELVAGHAVHAELWDTAVDYLRLAGTKAYSRGALDEAVSCYERALTIVNRLPPTDATMGRSIDVRLDLHAPLMTLGRTQDIARLYLEAERLARSLGDGVRLGRVLQRMSQLAWLSGRHRVGASYAREALDVAELTDDVATRLHAQYFLGLLRHALGDYQGALPCFAWVLEGPYAHVAARVIGVTVPMDVPAHCWHAYASAMTGDFARADESLRCAVMTAEASDFPQARVIARTIEAIVGSYAGRAETCIESMRTATELCERIGFVVWLAAAYSTLGRLLTQSGDVVAALPYLERGVAINEKTGVRTYHAQRHVWWADGLVRAGMVDDARARADLAVDLARTMEERGIEAEALLTRAIVESVRGDGRETRAWFERALVASTQIEARPLEAQCHLALAESLARSGNVADARHHQDIANQMFRRMGTRPWWPARDVT